MAEKTDDGPLSERVVHKNWKTRLGAYEELEKLCSQQNNSKTKLKNFSHYFECDDCGDRVCAGTQCWETGLTH